MPANKRAGTFPVEVKITDIKLLRRLFQLAPILCVDSTGQTVFGIVRDLQRFVKALGLDNRKHGAEDLFLSNPCRRRNVRDYGGLDKVTSPCDLPAPAHQASFF